MQTIACIKWGTAYPDDYVNRLYRGVMRHVTRPSQFILFTDNASDLEPGVIVKPIPAFQLPASGMRGGPWRKLALWSPELDADGDLLFLDLDVVVTGTLDPFFDYEPGKLCLIRNWTQAGDGIGNSSVMRFRARSAPHLFEAFERDPVAMSFRCVNEQMYITRDSGLPLAFWPDEWCPSFKHMLQPRFPANLWREAELPMAARIVIFTGHPRPHEAATGAWPAPWYKKHYKSMRPVSWLADHWR
jgi:hypothetical protein